MLSTKCGINYLKRSLMELFLFLWQSAILGMHSIVTRPMVVGGQIVPRPMMYVALTYDHRLIDGREAVFFLRRIKDIIEDPRRLLLDIWKCNSRLLANQTPWDSSIIDIVFLTFVVLNYGWLWFTIYNEWTTLAAGWFSEFFFLALYWSQFSQAYWEEHRSFSALNFYGTSMKYIGLSKVIKWFCCIQIFYSTVLLWVKFKFGFDYRISVQL